MSLDKVSNSEWIVPYNYLPEQFTHRKDIFDEWEELARSCEFTLGPKVAEFEKNFATFVGAEFCIATNNGTDALILALKALGIKSGDEVITVPNSFYATTGALLLVVQHQCSLMLMHDIKWTHHFWKGQSRVRLVPFFPFIGAALLPI